MTSNEPLPPESGLPPQASAASPSLGAASGDAGQPGSPMGRSAGERLAQAREDLLQAQAYGHLFAGETWGVPTLRRWTRGFADWLVVISWGKFFLLSFLLMVLAGVAFSFIIFAGGGEATRERGPVDVKVHIVPLTDGSLFIGPAPFPGERRGADAGARSRRKSVSVGDDGVLLQIDGDTPSVAPAVRIDNQGVRILADDAGGKASVVIDHNGVHIEKLPHANPPADAGNPAPAPVPPPAAPSGARRPLLPPLPPLPGSTAQPAMPPAVYTAGVPGLRIGAAQSQDPEKVAELIESAREQVESIVQDQVDAQVEALSRGEKVERENWLELLTVMGIIGLSILKVALGSRSKAELLARRASATAAEEGLKRQLAEAQLKTLQAQVEPHFLFNTLASVDYLIETDPPRASRMQKNLIQYLRAAVPQMREGSSSLGREVQQCRSYLEILKVRMDERLQFSISVPQGLMSASFPPMMLLTLVENAIKHGLEPKPDGGSLSVSAVVADGVLRVAVADSGMGFGVAQRGGTGVGLTNVRERLQALYGSAASLDIEASSDGGTIATLIVPYRLEAPAASAV